MQTIKLFFAAEVATSTAPVAPVLTSETLTKLNAEYDTAWQAMIAIKDSRSKEAKDAKLSLWKIDGAIKAEEANILKLQNDAKIAEARNERLKLSANYKAAILANTGKGANAETKQAEDTALELLNNELLARFSHSRPAKAKTEGENGVEKTDTSANKLAILELARAGKNHKEIEAAGYARSTVWHTINNAKKAGETFSNA